ncbi:MAG: PTS sugar transporter subunit IIC [Enterococcus avium]
MEEKILNWSNKLGNQRYLKAIRNSFITILPITVMGGLVAVISAAPVTEDTTNGFLLAWADFVAKNTLIFSWVNALTLGALAIYVCLTLTWFLCKHYKLDALIPMLVSFFGVMLLTIEPQKLAFDGKTAEISYIDGKGLLVGFFVSIVTVELFRILKAKHFGEIKLPSSVPASLSDTFSSLATTVVIMGLFSFVYALFNHFDTTMAIWVTTIITPSLKATDSLWFVLIMTILINIGWFFGIHNATFWGLMGPIMFMNLSANAAAIADGQTPTAFLSEPTWAYFIIIGGVGNCLSLGILLCLSKSTQMRAVGRMGIIPAFFGISEPITFGLPIMLNPIMFIPNFLTGAVNATITYLLMNGGIIKNPFAMLSFNMPSIFGAYFSTSDIKASVLIVVLIAIDIVIYFPFFKMNERQQLKVEQATSD